MNPYKYWNMTAQQTELIPGLRASSPASRFTTATLVTKLAIMIIMLNCFRVLPLSNSYRMDTMQLRYECTILSDFDFVYKHYKMYSIEYLGNDSDRYKTVFSFNQFLITNMSLVNTISTDLELNRNVLSMFASRKTYHKLSPELRQENGRRLIMYSMICNILKQKAVILHNTTCTINVKEQPLYDPDTVYLYGMVSQMNTNLTEILRSMYGCLITHNSTFTRNTGEIITIRYRGCYMESLFYSSCPGITSAKQLYNLDLMCIYEVDMQVYDILYDVLTPCVLILISRSPEPSQPKTLACSIVSGALLHSMRCNSAGCLCVYTQQTCVTLQPTLETNTAGCFYVHTQQTCVTLQPTLETNISCRGLWWRPQAGCRNINRTLRNLPVLIASGSIVGNVETLLLIGSAPCCVPILRPYLLTGIFGHKNTFVGAPRRTDIIIIENLTLISVSQHVCLASEVTRPSKIYKQWTIFLITSKMKCTFVYSAPVVYYLVMGPDREARTGCIVVINQYKLWVLLKITSKLKCFFVFSIYDVYIIHLKISDFYFLYVCVDIQTGPTYTVVRHSGLMMSNNYVTQTHAISHDVCSTGYHVCLNRKHPYMYKKVTSVNQNLVNGGTCGQIITYFSLRGHFLCENICTTYHLHYINWKAGTGVCNHQFIRRQSVGLNAAVSNLTEWHLK